MTKPATTIGEYTVEFDPESAEAGRGWLVLDKDLDVLDDFDTEAEALADARERHEEDEAAGLRALIEMRLEDLNVAALRALSNYLNQIRLT